MSKLSKLSQKIIAAGKISEAQTEELWRLILLDGVVDLTEAECLFEICRAVDFKGAPKAWEELLIRGISDFLLLDEKTPGVVSKQECRWLINQLSNGIEPFVKTAIIERIRQQAILIELDLMV